MGLYFNENNILQVTNFSYNYRERNNDILNEGFTDKIKAFFTKAKEFVKKIWDKITAFFRKIFKKDKDNEGSSNASSGKIENVEKQLDSLSKNVDNVKSRGNTLISLVNKIKNIVENMEKITKDNNKTNKEIAILKDPDMLIPDISNLLPKLENSIDHFEKLIHSGRSIAISELHPTFLSIQDIRSITIYKCIGQTKPEDIDDLFKENLKRIKELIETKTPTLYITYNLKNRKEELPVINPNLNAFSKIKKSTDKFLASWGKTIDLLMDECLNMPEASKSNIFEVLQEKVIILNRLTSNLASFVISSTNIYKSATDNSNADIRAFNNLLRNTNKYGISREKMMTLNKKFEIHFNNYKNSFEKLKNKKAIDENEIKEIENQISTITSSMKDIEGKIKYLSSKATIESSLFI